MLMNSSKSIDHTGVVEEINGDQIKVMIEAASACSSCHAKGVCGVADTKEKHIEVQDPKNTFSIGEPVKVTMQQSYGFKALILGYVLPFFIVLILLFSVHAITGNEVMAGLISFCSLVPYYVTLYLKKDKIKEYFRFTIQRI